MGFTQLFNWQREKIIDDESLPADHAETTEWNPGSFCVGAEEIRHVLRHSKNITRLVFAEEDRMRRSSAFAEIDMKSLV